MNPNNLKELLKTRKAVKQKYLALKSDIAQSQTSLEKSLKPVSEPLQRLLQKIEPIKAKSEIKQDFSTSPIFSSKKEEKPFKQYLPLKYPEDTYSNINEDISSMETPDESVVEKDVEQENDLETTRQEILNLTQTPFYEEYLQTYDPLPRSFIDDSIRGDEEKFDRYYGLSHDMKTNFFTLGKSLLTFEGPDLKLGNLTYKGTPGLYELLFKKDPVGYSDNDLKQYMDILKRTNAYRRNFEADAQIQGSQSNKYRSIIRPYLIEHKILKEQGLPRTLSFNKPKPPSTRAKTSFKLGGMIQLSTHPIDYVYYDNVNEIVDRLRLLIASAGSGNNSHSLEINSIIEELKEAKIIK